MKTLGLIIVVCFLAIGATVSEAAHTGMLTRISKETGAPVSTLQTEKSTTGLGFGELETANLLAKASGKSFDDIVAMHKAGEGWGEIARDNGLNLGKLVSAAHRSSKAAMHAQNTQTVHGKSNTAFGKGHANTMKGIGRGGNSHGLGAFHGMGSFHGMGHMGHGH
jgi:hypothetical protein